ncbi:MAG: hypothetical protein IKT17_10400, partial [Lachnospiraceae bacterium]|nr:hypothetical protein [Lachnospiraceae bacterium]
MKDRRPVLTRIYALIFIMIAFLLIAYILLTEKRAETVYLSEMRDFSTGWKAPSGQEYTLDDATVKAISDKAGTDNETVILKKNLPSDLTEDDALCLESMNANFKVFIDGVEVYAFASRENLSGASYGRAFHAIGLSPDYSGGKIRLEFDTVCPDYKLSRLTEMYICPPLSYVRMYARKVAFPCLISFLVFFFGIVLAMVYIWIPDKTRLPFDIAALGMMAFLMGLWLIVDTRILQLFFGHIYVWRGINRTVLFLVGYPLISFFNSLTKLKRTVYHRIVIVGTVLIIGGLIGLRYLTGLDMLISYPPAIIVFIAGLAIITCIIFTDDYLYCRAHGIETNRKFFYIGVTAFLGCGIFDFILYATGIAASGSFGFFTRIGMLVFIAVMLFQFLTWWTTDQESIERDRF